MVFGPSISAPTKSVRVAAQFANPCYEVSSPACPNNQGKAFYDFGLLKLEAPVTDVAPIELNATPLGNGDVGKKIRHVGYGITETGGGGGTKREVTYNVRSIQPLSIESGAPGAQTCSGDSGGPAFMVTTGSTRERVVGVISFGDENCNQYGVDGRVDTSLSWLNTTMKEWEIPTCGEDGRCAPGCPQIDQDCACVADGQCTADCKNPARDADCPVDCGKNGICSIEACPLVDQDCVAEGGACASAEVCQSRECIRDGTNAGSYCSKNCQVDSDCGRGLKCGPVGVCILKPKTPRNSLEICDEFEDLCIGGNICAGPPDGITRCVKACTTQTDCEASTKCEAGAGGKRFCRPPEGVARFVPFTVPQAKLTANSTGGCSTVAGFSSAALWALAALALGARTRRRAAASN